ncbi:GH92 family glycosyl hydrolase [Arthrobacter sp. NPDC090010]|uniref:GH92 family glycosyl hydrolase n=1 Tax=Arthrobacter sp. NPDC090010 TaxID=3363942 RepID=UPI0038014E89
MQSSPLRTGGPSRTYNSLPGVGLVSPEASRIAGTGSWQEIPAPDIQSRAIAPGEELVYDWFPEAGPTLRSRWNATAFAVDLEFDDGSRLSSLRARDAAGTALEPRAQLASRRHLVDQWNRQRVDLQPFEGRVVARVLCWLEGDEAAAVWLDGPRIRPVPERAADPLERVLATRGSHSSDRFSRGNTAPLVGLPHGGVFGLPMTDAAAGNWPYAYHAHNRLPGNRPALAAFATSHLPSPWIGDRGVFQLMPSLDAAPATDREARALSFSHDAEAARAHEYRVTFDNGLRARMTAGNFALGLRFDGPEPVRSVVLDHLGTVTDVSFREESGASFLDVVVHDGGNRLPHYVHVRFPAGSTAHLLREPAGQDGMPDGALRLGGHVALPGAAGVADVVLGVSTVDAGQAAASLAAAGDYDAMLTAAQDAWRESLGVLEVEGLTAGQEQAIRSDLYRLFLYPNRHDEPAPDGSPRYRSPVDHVLREGRFGANNGFWDTYRTCWPLYGLLAPGRAGGLADAFVQHFRDSGWTSRWSAPGPVDSMTGTTTDTVFADLVAGGVTDWDVAGAYRSALINATVPAPRPEVGRKGLAEGRFRGFISTEVHEGMSWTLDNAINDWGAAVLAGWLAEGEGDDVHRARLRTEAEYLARRALGYRNVFHPGLGFFLGRGPDGAWRLSEDEYDPEVWGYDYTETNGWGTAFTAPHDGAGLARLHGGEDGLCIALDAFFSRPETADPALAGSYGFVIHEQTEARDVRMGMLGLSNQPAHHIPYMYCFTGQHDRAHRLVTTARDRLFGGSEIGQGFPGDEDNGEMSGWHLFACLGLYPLVPASGRLLLTPPLASRTVLRPLGGQELVITAEGAGKPYISSVCFNGRPWNRVDIPRSLLAAGGRLEFVLSDRPSGWAGDSRPWSLAGEDAHEVLGAALPGLGLPDRPWRDLLSSVPGFVTDDAGAAPLAVAAGESVVAELVGETPLPTLYTVTLQDAQEASWRVEARDVAGEWHLLDHREGEEFEREGQVRPFRPADDGASRGALFTAVRFTALSPLRLVQLEMLE